MSIAEELSCPYTKTRIAQDKNRQWPTKLGVRGGLGGEGFDTLFEGILVKGASVSRPNSKS